MFLEHVLEIVQYWAALPNKTKLERCSGTAFSILVALDGGAAFLPHFDVVARPHPEDEAYHKSLFENFWASHGTVINDNPVSLHDEFIRMEMEKERKVKA